MSSSENPHPRWRLIATLFLTVSMAACGAHFQSDARPPNGIGRYRCDVDASEVVVENATNPEEVRDWAAEALQEMSPQVGLAQPARFRLRVNVDTTNSAAYWLFSPLTFTYGVFIGAPWWGTLGHVTVNADLTFDIGGKRMMGVGEDTQDMKAPGSPSEYYRAAVHNAVQNAFESAYEMAGASPVAGAR